jgi:glycosyltransferase involved in cell wall biosynthesis
MRVGLNARLVGTGRSFRRAGVSRYIANLIDHLPAALEPADEMVIVGRPSSDEERPSPIGRAGRHPIPRIAWEQTVLPVLALRGRWDLLHSPVNVAPLIPAVPSVVTVHDLAFLVEPDTMPAGRRRYLTALTAHSVRRAARVIAVSESTRRDLERWFDVPPERVTVTPLAADPRFRPPDEAALSVFRRGNALDRPYILSVGTREPRKNGALLVRAFAALSREIPHDLVMVGPSGWLGEELDQTLAGLDPAVRERVRLTGFVADDDLPLWYGAADAFAYPARYEGFGLPVLEAMACGVPVVTSNVSSLPEVAGDAALLVDPDDAGALVDALRRIVTDPRLAGELRSRGLARATTYSWAETARLTVDAYRAALG